MFLPTSTLNTTKGKAQISKRKNDLPVARSKKKPRAVKKGVRRGSTSSQADPAENEFVDSCDEKIDFKKYMEVQETFWRDCTDAYCFGLNDTYCFGLTDTYCFDLTDTYCFDLTDTKSVSINQCFCSEDGSINVRALE